MTKSTVESSKYICIYPFSRMEANLTRFIPCCSAWLRLEFHQLDHGKDPWNGPAAQALREKILNGDYSFCRREHCKPVLAQIDRLNDSQEAYTETPISKENQLAIERKNTYMPEGPGAISIRADPRCNLACQSCRPTYIHTIPPSLELRLVGIERFMTRNRMNIRTTKLAGDGEVFFSKFLRKTLQNFSKETFPNLTHLFILSNGILCNQKNFDELRPGTNFIKKVSISVDAGSQEVYQKVRGGDWNKLIRNLTWLSKIRLEGRIEYLDINFTTMADNFQTLPGFFELGRELRVDQMIVNMLDNWPRMKINDYSQQAIHQQRHPMNSELEKILSKYAMDKNITLNINKESES